jgi:hypothetical protein
MFIRFSVFWVVIVVSFVAIGLTLFDSVIHYEPFAAPLFLRAGSGKATRHQALAYRFCWISSTPSSPPMDGTTVHHIAAHIVILPLFFPGLFAFWCFCWSFLFPSLRSRCLSLIAGSVMKSFAVQAYLASRLGKSKSWLLEGRDRLRLPHQNPQMSTINQLN